MSSDTAKAVQAVSKQMQAIFSGNQFDFFNIFYYLLLLLLYENVADPFFPSLGCCTLLSMFNDTLPGAIRRRI